MAGRRGLPLSWRTDPVLTELGSVEAVVGVVRRIGADSDRVTGALLGLGPADGLVVPVVVAALGPLVVARCRGDRAAADDLVTELTIAVAEAQRDGLEPSGRRLVNVLLDRAWDRHRAPTRRPDPAVVVDPAVLGGSLVSPAAGPDRVAVNRVALVEFRDQLAASAVAQGALVRSWNSALELAASERATQAERDRWKYVRAQLRRHGSADLVR